MTVTGDHIEEASIRIAEAIYASLIDDVGTGFKPINVARALSEVAEAITTTNDTAHIGGKMVGPTHGLFEVADAINALVRAYDRRTDVLRRVAEDEYNDRHAATRDGGGS